MTATLTPVVVTLEDSQVTRRWLLSRRSSFPDTVTIDPAPDYKLRLADVGVAALDGLGKNRQLSTVKRRAEHRAAAWLGLAEVSHALCVDVASWPTRTVHEAIEYFISFNVRPWLIIFDHGEQRSVVEGFVRDVKLIQRAVTISDDEFRKRWHGEPTEGESEETSMQAVFPTVPRVDGIRFRSHCRTLLSEEDFALVDATFVRSVQEIRSEIQALRGAGKTRAVESVLHRHLEDTEDLELLIVTTRAAQVACLTSGWHVSVDLRRLVGSGMAHPRRGRSNPEGWWRHLDEYPDPDYGFICAALVAGVAPSVLPELRLGDVKLRNGGWVLEVDGTVLSPSEESQRFLQAQKILREHQGASADDRLLVTHRAAHVRPHLVRARVHQVTAELGVKIAATPLHAPPASRTWLSRHGIEVRKLEKTATAEAA